MRKERAFGWIAVALTATGAAAAAVMVGTTGCSDDPQAGCARKVVTSAEGCAISADCAAAGLDLTCVNGVCRLPCRSDADCDLVANADPSTPAECRATAANTPAAICRAGVCEVSCPDAPCPAAETCFDGRCVLYGEGFEPPEGALAVDLQLLGFNDPPGELRNTRTRIRTSGLEGCTPAVDRNCDGPAGQGQYFVVLETEPTPPKGSPVTGTTCRACACCLECLAEPPTTPALIGSCPTSRNIPTPLSCAVSHPNCAAVCSACDQCPAADRPGVADNPLMAACEKTAAQRRCALCDACDAFLGDCQATQCPACLSAPTSEACRTCVDDNCLGDQRCRDCLTCADAQNCTDPGSGECNQLNEACEQQGEAGCFDVPVDYLRAELTDAEQALTSPVIDLSAAAGDVILQLDYVSFDVGVAYFPGRQGVPPEEWTEAPQSVAIQLCGGACGPTAWIDASQTDGRPAVLPADGQRNNGRLLGDQTILDWRTGRVVVAVPPALRTPSFRFRLLPQLADGARLAVDNIMIRRAP